MRHRTAILPAINGAPARGPDATPAPSDFETGYAAGVEAKSGEVGTALAALDAARREIESRIAILEAQYRRQCAATLAEIISAAAPAICEAAARGAIAEIFDSAPGAAAPPELTLRASPDILEAIKGEVDPAQAALFTIDDALAPGSLEAHWRDGGLDCDVGRSLFAIVEFLNAQSAPQAEEHQS